MKRNLILTGILGLLFMGGVFIYDFSDAMDEKLTGHKWYIVENNKTYVMSFKDNNFAYTDINGKVIDEYKDCEMYHYNSNTNVVKLSCNIDKNKLYIATYDDDKLVLTINGREKSYFSTEDLAVIDNFKESNHLSEAEYANLMNIKFDEKLYVSASKVKNLIKSTDNSYLVFIDSNINTNNAFSYFKLKELLDSSKKTYHLIELSALDEEEIASLSPSTSKLQSATYGMMFPSISAFIPIRTTISFSCPIEIFLPDTRSALRSLGYFLSASSMTSTLLPSSVSISTGCKDVSIGS